MKRLSILLILGLSIFFAGNANAHFIGLNYHHHHLIKPQITPQVFSHPFPDFGLFLREWNNWPELLGNECRWDCTAHQAPENGNSAAVPEPATVLLTLMGVFGLGMSKRKRK
jgi:hypothetical protein